MQPEPLGAAPSLTSMLLAVLCLGALIWLLTGWKTATERPTFDIKCAVPSEFETLVVYVNADARGRLKVKCGPLVGGAGAYTR